MFDVCGKVALVTGGASGIGYAISKQLLLNSARGVVVADNNLSGGYNALEKLSEEFGKESVIFIHTDVSDKKSFEEALKAAVDVFGHIDILVNNAGIFNEKDYEREIAVNMTGVTHGIMLGLEYITKHKSGTEGVIINTSSVTGTRVFVTTPIYGGIKSAIVSMTMAFGNDVHYRRTNVKVVAIAPGVTLTPINDNLEFFHESCAELGEKLYEILIPQTAELVADNMIKIMKEKPTGTVWISEGDSDLCEYLPSIPTQKIE